MGPAGAGFLRRPVVTAGGGAPALGARRGPFLVPVLPRGCSKCELQHAQHEERAATAPAAPVPKEGRARPARHPPTPQRRRREAQAPSAVQPEEVDGAGLQVVHGLHHEQLRGRGRLHVPLHRVPHRGALPPHVLVRDLAQQVAAVEQVRVLAWGRWRWQGERLRRTAPAAVKAPLSSPAAPSPGRCALRLPAWLPAPGCTRLWREKVGGAGLSCRAGGRLSAARRTSALQTIPGRPRRNAAGGGGSSAGSQGRTSSGCASFCTRCAIDLLGGKPLGLPSPSLPLLPLAPIASASSSSPLLSTSPSASSGVTTTAAAARRAASARLGTSARAGASTRGDALPEALRKQGGFMGSGVGPQQRQGCSKRPPEGCRWWAALSANSANRRDRALTRV